MVVIKEFQGDRTVRFMNCTMVGTVNGSMRIMPSCNFISRDLTFTTTRTKVKGVCFMYFSLVTMRDGKTLILGHLVLSPLGGVLVGLIYRDFATKRYGGTRETMEGYFCVLYYWSYRFVSPCFY